MRDCCGRHCGHDALFRQCRILLEKGSFAMKTRLARHVAKISEEDDQYKLLLFNTDRSTTGDTAAVKVDAADITHLARFVAFVAKIIDAL